MGLVVSGWHLFCMFRGSGCPGNNRVEAWPVQYLYATPTLPRKRPARIFCSHRLYSDRRMGQERFFNHHGVSPATPRQSTVNVNGACVVVPTLFVCCAIRIAAGSARAGGASDDKVRGRPREEHGKQGVCHVMHPPLLTLLNSCACREIRESTLRWSINRALVFSAS